MSTSFSLSPRIEVFPCPACRQTLNTTMETCGFCGTAIDRTAAESSATAFALVNQACSDASYLKIMAGTAIAFFFLRFVPFLTLMGVGGLWFLELAMPYMVIRWFVRYGAIHSDDRDFTQARSAALSVAIGVAAFLFLIAFGILHF